MYACIYACMHSLGPYTLYTSVSIRNQAKCLAVKVCSSHILVLKVPIKSLVLMLESAVNAKTKQKRLFF